MYNLLNACAHKYLKSASVWIILAAAFAAGIACGLSKINSLGLSYGVDFSDIIELTPVLLCGPMVTLNFGKEYEYGTFRSKLAVGATKGKIYLSELLTAVFAVAAEYILFGAGYAAVCRKILAGTDVRHILKISLLMVLGGAVITSLCVFVSSVIQSRAAALAVFLSVMFVMFLVGEMLYSLAWDIETENLYYGEAYEAILGRSTLDPETGKLIDLYPRGLPGVTLAELLMFAAAGVFVFGKKNIK